MYPCRGLHGRFSILVAEYLVANLLGFWWVYEGPGWVGPFTTLRELEIHASAL